MTFNSDEDGDYREVEIISDDESIEDADADDVSEQDPIDIKPSFKLLKNEFLSLFLTLTVLFAALAFFVFSIVFKSSDSEAVVATPDSQFNYALRIDLNSADAVMLELLPGIGPKISEKIIDYRDKNGGFQSVEELEKIKGISLRMVNTLRPFVFVNLSDN